LFLEGTLDERDEKFKNQYGIVLDESSKRELDKVSMYSEWMEEVIKNAETMVKEANQRADEVIGNAETMAGKQIRGLMIPRRTRIPRSSSKSSATPTYR